ncbi:MAG: class I SAM-dependent methyltransferase [Promethearchaeia archaeon]
MTEKERVYYNFFAHDYHLKRKQPWRAFLDFIEKYVGKDLFRSITTGISVDLGCANGRHFEVINSKHNHLIGIDNSIEFLTIARKTQLEDNFKTIHLCCADINYLPLRTASVDNFISIATLHHISSEKNRKRVMEIIFKSLKKEGYLLFSVWRRWQKKFFSHFLLDKIKRLFLPKYRICQEKLGLKEFGDKLVPWTVSQTNKTYYRFYHLFSKREAKHLCEDFEIVKFEAIGGPTHRDNFFILCQK